MEKPRPSNVIWGVLGASVAIYEYYAPEGELMSEAVDRALQKPLARYLVIGAVAITAAHLLNIPERLNLEQYDPIHRLGQIKR